MEPASVSENPPQANMPVTNTPASQVNVQKKQESNKISAEIVMGTKDYLAIILLVFFYPLGVLVVDFFTNWPKKVKLIISIPIIFVLVGILAIIASIFFIAAAPSGIIDNSRNNINSNNNTSASEKLENVAIFESQSSATISAAPTNTPTPTVSKNDNTSDARRLSDTYMLLNATGAYVADHEGELPPEITTKVQKISSNGADLCKYFVPSYIPALPIDPSINSEAHKDCLKEYDTGYTIVKDLNGQVTVAAPNATTQTISNTR